MKNSEEQIQHQIENGEGIISNEDVRAYQLVFDVLKKEPDFHVSLPFADKVIAIIEKRDEKRDYWWLAIGILFTVIALIVAIALTNVTWTTGIFTFLSGNFGLIAFGLAFVLFLHWLDKRLVRKHIGMRSI